MASSAAAAPVAGGRAAPLAGRALGAGLLTGYLSLIVLIPLAAVVWRSLDEGRHAFWDAVSRPEAIAALKLTLAAALVVAAINAVAGTAIAWVLVRDRFVGRGLVNAVIDLPFALPTIVAGLVLLALYGPSSPLGMNIAFTRTAIVLALLFVTLPFVVRAVQPVLLELDREMEEAAESLGAGPIAVFRRIVFPNLLPAILSGVALAFARAIGEFGSVVLISGNLPFKTQVASVYIFGRIESQDPAAAAAVSVVLLAISLGVLLLIAAITVAANTVFGVALSLALVRGRFRARGLVNAVVDLPLALSPVVVGLALFLLYGRGGWLGGLAEHGVKILFAVPGMVLATIFVTTPFVVREVVPVLREIGTEQEQAAETLGASPLQTFWRVTLPAIRWGVAYGVVLTLARSIGEFGAVSVVSGRIEGKTQTMTLFVQTQWEGFNFVGAYAAAVVLALIALAAVAAMTVFKPKEETS